MLPAEPASGESIGFDVGVDINDDPSFSGRQCRVAMAASAIGGGSSRCAAAPIGPWCDDRAFCTASTYIP